MTKNERHKKIEELLLTPGRKWRKTDLATRLKVHRSIIGRDINELQDSLNIIEENSYYYIDPNMYISNIEMNIHEKLALHLATRLLVRKSDIASEHFISLLTKLEVCFKLVSPNIAKIVGDTKGSFIEKQSEQGSKKKSQILKYLNQGWLKQQKVRIKYRSPGSDSSKIHLCSIYYLEPYADGLSLHVIAFDNKRGKIVDFKFERIEKVSESMESYEIPDDFCASTYFKDAWGIWVKEGEPICVKLRFNQDTAKRVMENRWHHSQETKEDTEGSLIWTCKVNEPQEMVPWIRGWGCGVEVLEPVELRESIKIEVEKMVEIYKEK